MGDKVSFLDSLLVTVFSMLVVFIVLIVIAYLINLLKIISNRDKESKTIQKEKVEEHTAKNHEIVPVEGISDELVAALTASIAVKEGVDADKVKIKSIKKLNNNLNLEDNPAVIAAAVAANLGLNIPNINIKSIRRVPQNINTWADMGRREQLQ